MSVGPMNVSFVPRERLITRAPRSAAQRIACEVLNEEPPGLTLQGLGAQIVGRPHGSRKNGWRGGLSPAGRGKFVTMTAAVGVEPAAAPDTNEPAMTRTATRAASRRARALNRADNRGKPPRFRGLDAHMNRASS